MKHVPLRLIVGLVTVFVTGVPSAQATPITFNFNSLLDGASNTTVQNSMRATITAALGAGPSVTVTGSKGEANYTGDNHVVGPVTGTVVKSNTLGTSDLGVYRATGLDTFLINNGSDRITMTFTFPIYSVSFDYEIFPNSNCATGTCSAANWPDFKFEANDVVQFTQLGVMPASLLLGGHTRSPFSQANTEQAPQFIGQSGQYLFANGVTKLEFIDWPVLIGIDNLVIDNVRTSTNTSVPGPSTLLLFVTGLTAAVVARRLGKSTTTSR